VLSGNSLVDITVHKGQKRVNMATNFGTKIAINAFLRDITRMWLLITDSLHARPMHAKTTLVIVRSKGRCHGYQILAKMRKNITKWPQLQLCMTYPRRVWFWDRVCAIGEFICDTVVHKGQRELTMATNLWTKIAINAFLRETTGMWLLITGSLRGRPICRRHFWLQDSNARSHDNHILTKIGENHATLALT